MHPTENLLATAGLDRYLRVYSTDTKRQGLTLVHFLSST